jgi:nicotinamide-nucleotide amidase
MKYDLIIVGNELLNGKIQDLNTHYLAGKLYERGDELRKVHIIGDDENLFFEALDAAWAKSDVVITTGGLGPTQDDLTKAILARYFDKPILFCDEAFQVTKKQYGRGGRKYNREKIDYHNIPQDFRVVYNPIGYAPGLSFKQDHKSLYATPGVPTEFQEMLRAEIFPSLKSTQNNFTKHVIIKTWKIAEAKIFHQLCPDLWQQLADFGEVSSLPHLMGVDIGIKLVESDSSVLAQKEQAILNLIQVSPLKDFIWHIGPEKMEEVIIQEARAKKLTLGFAESCTGGLLASKITDISGSSSVFWGSVVSYANQVKIKSLQVKESTLKEFGAVSAETAKEMAIGARSHLGVDIAVTTTGIAGPGGATASKPVGTVGIGVSSSKGDSSDVYYYQGSRKSLKEKFAQAALIILLEEIRKI